MTERSGPEPPEPDDKALLAAHVAGDDDAFGILFGRHRDRLWAVALRTTGDPEEAADALQDGMVSAFRRAGSYRGEAAVTTWLHRIVVNACLDRLRRRKVRHTEALPEDLHRWSEGAPGGPAPSRAESPEEHALAGDLRTTVLAALATLPAEQRAALVLVDMEGYSVEETARILEVAPGTVKSRCSRGRARLAPLLTGLRNPGSPPRVPSTEEPTEVASRSRPTTSPDGGVTR